MSDATDHALPYVERDVNGQSVKFARLSPRDRARMLAEFKKSARAEKVQSCKDSGIPAEQTYVELNAFDEAIWGYYHWVKFVNSFDGQEKVQRESLTRQKYPPTDIDAILDGLTVTATESIKLAAEVSGLVSEAATPPGMKFLGELNGVAVYTTVDGKKLPEAETDPNPTAPPSQPTTAEKDQPAKLRGYGT